MDSSSKAMVIKEDHIDELKEGELRLVSIAELGFTSIGGQERGRSEGSQDEQLVGNELHVSFSRAGTEGVDKRQDSGKDIQISPIESSEGRQPYDPMVEDTIRQESRVQIARPIQGSEAAILRRMGTKGPLAHST